MMNPALRWVCIALSLAWCRRTPPLAPEPRRESIQHAIELTRLACVAYETEREIGMAPAVPEADVVCRLLLDEKDGGE